MRLKFISRILLALVGLLMLLMFVGCGARKRKVQREFEKSEFLTMLDSISKFTLKTEVKTELHQSELKTESEIEIEYEGAEGDLLTITQMGPNGEVKAKTTLQGKGKAKVTNKDKKTDTQSSEVSSEKQDLESGVSVQKKEEGLSESESENISVERESIQIALWFWILIILILIISAIYLNKRFKLVKGVTDFFIKLFNLRKNIKNEN